MSVASFDEPIHIRSVLRNFAGASDRDRHLVWQRQRQPSNVSDRWICRFDQFCVAHHRFLPLFHCEASFRRFLGHITRSHSFVDREWMANNSIGCVSLRDPPTRLIENKQGTAERQGCIETRCIGIGCLKNCWEQFVEFWKQKIGRNFLICNTAGVDSSCWRIYRI